MYTENEKAIIWLSLFDSLTYIKTAKLVALYQEPKQIILNLIKDKQKIRDIVGEDTYNQMINFDFSLLNSYINNLTNQNIKCITRYSTNYPEKLLNINLSPVLLFAKGDVSLLNKPAVAVVGTRTPTAYGRDVAGQYSKAFAKSGLVVVSGLASGVDKIAHETTLKENGKTIAVLGSGFDMIYPAINENLAREIGEKGLLISEFKPNVKATKYSFPFRNRIISALSDSVLIVETGEKSGTFHTKNYAIEQGKNVFAIPCNINNSRTVGNNILLKSGQALMTTSPKDILDTYNLSKFSFEEKKVEQTTITEKLVLDFLSDGNKSIEELQEFTKLELKNLNSCLTLLQIRGLIKKLPGNQFSL